MKDDTISRQAAIEAVGSMLRRKFGIGGDLAEITLAGLPSAKPERKKGKWISREGREDCYECSECHAVIESNEVYWRNNYFCYHCGADMMGEQDE